MAEPTEPHAMMGLNFDATDPAETPMSRRLTLTFETELEAAAAAFIERYRPPRRNQMAVNLIAAGYLALHGHRHPEFRHLLEEQGLSAPRGIEPSGGARTGQDGRAQDDEEPLGPIDGIGV